MKNNENQKKKMKIIENQRTINGNQRKTKTMKIIEKPVWSSEVYRDAQRSDSLQEHLRKLHHLHHLPADTYCHQCLQYCELQVELLAKNATTFDIVFSHCMRVLSRRTASACFLIASGLCPVGAQHPLCCGRQSESHIDLPAMTLPLGNRNGTPFLAFVMQVLAVLATVASATATPFAESMSYFALLVPYFLWHQLSHGQGLVAHGIDHPCCRQNRPALHQPSPHMCVTTLQQQLSQGPGLVAHRIDHHGCCQNGPSGAIPL